MTPSATMPRMSSAPPVQASLGDRTRPRGDEHGGDADQERDRTEPQDAADGVGTSVHGHPRLLLGVPLDVRLEQIATDLQRPGGQQRDGGYGAHPGTPDG